MQLHETVQLSVCFVPFIKGVISGYKLKLIGYKDRNAKFTGNRQEVL